MRLSGACLADHRQSPHRLPGHSVGQLSTGLLWPKLAYVLFEVRRIFLKSLKNCCIFRCAWPQWGMTYLQGSLGGFAGRWAISCSCNRELLLTHALLCPQLISLQDLLVLWLESICSQRVMTSLLTCCLPTDFPPSRIAPANPSSTQQSKSWFPPFNILSWLSGAVGRQAKRLNASLAPPACLSPSDLAPAASSLRCSLPSLALSQLVPCVLYAQAYLF